MQIEAIRSMSTENEAMFFIVTLRRAGAPPIDIAATAALLLDYSAFQRHVLTHTGQLYLFDVAEGRAPCDANYWFRREVQSHLARTIANQGEATSGASNN